MADARCSCGALALTVPASATLVVACHCLECQRRTGSPFGVGAFYPLAAVSMSGTSTEFARTGSSGGTVRNHFCPTCGTTVYWTADKVPGLVGVAIGALADPSFPGPDRSIHEQCMHAWVRIEGASQHLQQGSTPTAAG
jgi:hypothetical protein